VTDILYECPGSDCSLPGGDAARKQLACLLKVRRGPREQHARVGAVGSQPERLARERRSSGPRRLPRVIDQILCLVLWSGGELLGAAQDRGERARCRPQAARRDDRFGLPVFRTNSLPTPLRAARR